MHLHLPLLKDVGGMPEEEPKAGCKNREVGSRTGESRCRCRWIGGRLEARCSICLAWSAGGRVLILLLRVVVCGGVTKCESISHHISCAVSTGVSEQANSSKLHHPLIISSHISHHAHAHLALTKHTRINVSSRSEVQVSVSVSVRLDDWMMEPRLPSQQLFQTSNIRVRR